MGKPNGILGRATLGVTAASATDVTTDEVIDLFYSLPRQWRARASFVMNDTTVQLLRKKKASTGDYLYQPGLQEGEPARLLGRPLYTSSYMPTVATGNKSIIVGDFSQYYIALRSGIVMQVLRERYAEEGKIGFKAFERIDGIL